MTPTSRSIRRTYYALQLGNTLAASLIWGINTIFLLDAGLTNLEAFAANAFFTAGMVIFEVPTGIVADMWGRRTSFLLGTVTLAVTTALYVLLWQLEAPFWQWAVVSLLLGLGFTFFSGAVEAWLVDALDATGFTGPLESVFARGQVITGVGMLVGSVGGGYIAQATNLGVPFVLRAAVLALMFVFAFVLMRDVGFTPEQERPAAGPRSRASHRTRSEYGWRVPPVRYLMLAGLVHRRRRHLRLLRPAAASARPLRRPRGLRDRRPGRGDRRRRRRSSAASRHRRSASCSSGARPRSWRRTGSAP